MCVMRVLRVCFLGCTYVRLFAWFTLVGLTRALCVAYAWFCFQAASGKGLLCVGYACAMRVVAVGAF